MLELMQLLQPQTPPEPKGVSFRREIMKLGPRYSVPRKKQSAADAASKTAVRRKLLAAGVRKRALRSLHNAVLVGANLDRAIELRAIGWSFVRIAHLFGVHRRTASDAVRRKGKEDEYNRNNRADGPLLGVCAAEHAGPVPDGDAAGDDLRQVVGQPGLDGDRRHEPLGAL